VHPALVDLRLDAPPADGYLAWLADWTYAPNRESFVWFTEHVASHLSDDVLARVRTFGAGQPPRKGAHHVGWDRVPRLVEHAGFVDPLSAVYPGARAVIAPVVRGAGVNNKVLEPLAAGRPVVTTSIGIRGLSPAITRQVTCGATPAAFAARIAEVIDRPGTPRDAEEARESVRPLSWDAAGEAMEQALVRALDAARSTSVPRA
jgi:glycosyltransferase involved in cell wall biosynthesis